MRQLMIAAALLLLAAGPALAAGDAAAGEQKAAVCKACHNWGAGATNKIGPVLNGVVGRQPGTYDGYNYSSAMVAFGQKNPAWTPELLDQFLSGPRKLVPGTKMTFGGFADANDRANVIAFLQTLSDEK